MTATWKRGVPSAIRFRAKNIDHVLGDKAATRVDTHDAFRRRTFERTGSSMNADGVDNQLINLEDDLGLAFEQFQKCGRRGWPFGRNPPSSTFAVREVSEGLEPWVWGQGK